MFIKTIILFTVLLLFVSCQPPVLKNLQNNPKEDFLTAHLSYTRSGFQNFKLNDSLRIVDTQSLSGLPYFSFLQYSGELIYATHNGRLYFTSLDDFDNTRKTQIAVGVGTSPTIKGSTLFIAVNRGKYGLIAYNMLTGDYLWQKAGELSQSSPIVVNNLVIHATTSGAVSAYDIDNGERKWKVEIEDRILNNLAYAENNIIVLTQNGTLRSYGPDKGTLNWSLTIEDAFYASPVLNAIYIFTASYNGVVSKVDLLKGSILNSVTTGSNIYQTPVLDDQCIYVGEGDGQLTAIDINTLAKKWTKQLDGPVTAAPLLSVSEIILGTASQKLYRIDKNDGRINQVIRLDGRPRSQPIYHDHKIYVAYEPDYLAVLTDGSRK